MRALCPAGENCHMEQNESWKSHREKGDVCTRGKSLIILGGQSHCERCCDWISHTHRGRPAALIGFMSLHSVWCEKILYWLLKGQCFSVMSTSLHFFPPCLRRPGYVMPQEAIVCFVYAIRRYKICQLGYLKSSTLKHRDVYTRIEASSQGLHAESYVDSDPGWFSAKPVEKIIWFIFNPLFFVKALPRYSHNRWEIVTIVTVHLGFCTFLHRILHQGLVPCRTNFQS